MTLTTISSNKHYIIEIAPEKNRAYLKIIGFWRSPEVVPSYIADWKKALAGLKKDFTLLTDASEMKTHPQELRKLHEEAQTLLLKSHVRKVAEIMQNDVTEMQLDSVAKTTQFPKKNFRDRATAEAWLDEA
jgi:hypothetical protein